MPELAEQVATAIDVVTEAKASRPAPVRTAKPKPREPIRTEPFATDAEREAFEAAWRKKHPDVDPEFHYGPKQFGEPPFFKDVPLPPPPGLVAPNWRYARREALPTAAGTAFPCDHCELYFQSLGWLAMHNHKAHGYPLPR